MRLLLLLILAAIVHGAVSVPTLNVPATARATVGVPFVGLIDATDSPSSFAATGLPPGLALGTGSGVISGSPTTAGTYSVSVSATNTAGTGSATISITVDAAGTAQVGNADLYRLSENGACSLQLVATGTPDFMITDLPDGLNPDSNGLISGVPMMSGVSWVTVSADAGTTATTLTMAVRAAQVGAPGFTLLVQPQASAGAPFAFVLTTTATGTPSFSCSNLPGWLTLGSGLISGTPAATDTSVNLKLSASDGSAAADTVIAIPLAIPAAGDAVPLSPALVDATVDAGLGWIATASVAGASFSALDALPTGLSLDPSTGMLTGEPDAAGDYNVRLVADAGTPTAAMTTTMAFRIRAAAAGAPIIDPLVPPSLTVGAPCALSVTTGATTATSYSILPATPFAIDPTGLITGTPVAAGVLSLRITATNASGSCVTTVLARIAAATAGAPLPGGPVVLRASVGSPFSAALLSTPSATGWTALGLPPELAVTSYLGLISGTPVDAAVSNLQATSTSGSGSNVTAMTLRTAVVPGAPAFTTAGPWYVSTGQPVRIALSAPGATSWAATGLPAGLAIDGDGTVSGTPTAAGGADLQVTASRNSKSTTTTMALFVQTPAVGSPVFTGGGLLSGTVGAPFTGSLSATGATLGYSATPLPAGLALDTATGAITGTPTTAGTTAMQVTAQNPSGTAQTVVVIRIASSGGSGTDQPVSGVSGGGCGAGAAGVLALAGLGLGLRRRRR